MESANIFNESNENPEKDSAPVSENQTTSETKRGNKDSEYRVQVGFSKYLRAKIASQGSPLQPGETFNRTAEMEDTSSFSLEQLKGELGSFAVFENQTKDLNSKQLWELLQTKVLERELKEEAVSHTIPTPESVAADFDTIQKIWETAAQDFKASVSPERYKEFLDLIMRAAEDIPMLERFLENNKDLTSEERFYVQMVIEVKNARLLEQKILPHSPDAEIDTWPKEKKAAWEEKKEMLELAGFEHGEHGIEKRILDTVVVLNLLGLNTSESCEGHTHKGSNVPFVVFEPQVVSRIYGGSTAAELDAYSTPRPGSPEYQDFMEHIKKETKAMEAKLQTYLDEFNARSPRDPYNFVISEFTPGQSFMITSEGFDPGKKFKPEYRSAILAEARKKMNSLTAFLKEKYLAE